MKIKGLAGSCVLALAAAMAGGCYQYVNIPADSGDVAMHSVNADHVVSAEYEALRAVVADTPVKGKYLIVLPKLTGPAAYDQVVARLGSGATWSPAMSQPSVPTLEVKHVSIRGLSASVDVIRPADMEDFAGPRQLVTVDLELYPVGGWSAKRLHAWRMSLDDAMLQSRSGTESP